MKPAILALLIIAATLPTFANASVITLESQWCCASMPGTLTFSYDDAILDNVADAFLDGPLQQNQVQVGGYSNAITDARYVVNSGVDSGKVFSFIPSSSSNIAIIRKYSALGTSVNVNFRLSDGIDDYLWSVLIEGYPPLTDSLQELLGIRVADMATMFKDSNNEAIPSRAFSILRYNDNLAFKEVASVPEPGELGLFAAGMIGLFAANRRRKVV